MTDPADARRTAIALVLARLERDRDAEHHLVLDDPDPNHAMHAVDALLDLTTELVLLIAQADHTTARRLLQKLALRAADDAA